MSYVRITLSKEMLQSLLANLTELRTPASEFLVESDVEGNNETTRIINILSGDVFEQTVQRQEFNDFSKQECRIYEFPSKAEKGEKI